MSLGLAMRQIGQYTGEMMVISGKIADTEAEAITATAAKDDAKMKLVQQKLTLLKTLFGLIKDFIEFWKDVIKSVMGLLKSLNELAQGAR